MLQPDEEREELVDAPKGHAVAFLPFLRLKRGHTVAGVEFLPLRDGSGTVPPSLESAVAPLDTILSGYVDRQGKPFTNCVVATIPVKGWDIDRSDFPVIQWAASLLFLGTWASNKYMSRFGGEYVNSTTFRLVGQAYSGSMPYYISVAARRRDGESLDGGYKHGKVTFSLPFQCSVRSEVKVDEPFLAALDAAVAAGSPIIERLRTALPFVELANTDDDFLTEHAEALLMGSAFEQLLRGDGSAYRLTRQFGDLFAAFGSVTVADAQATRPDIQINPSPRDHFAWRLWTRVRKYPPQNALTTKIDNAFAARTRAAQLKWWVHRKWMEELYGIRSKVVHRGTAGGRRWGWALFHHLVMAAHVFPLVVKLLLQQEGHYTLTDDDRVACLAVDKLLKSTDWRAEDEDGREIDDSWAKILWTTKLHMITERAVEKLSKQSRMAFRPTTRRTRHTVLTRAMPAHGRR